MTNPEYDRALVEIERLVAHHPWDIRELAVKLYHTEDISERHCIDAVFSLLDRGRIGRSGWHLHRTDSTLGAKIATQRDERASA